MPCGCKCHAGGPHATCDLEHDTGSSGVPGVPSCSPCDYVAAGDIDQDEEKPRPCRRCGETGRHDLVDGDCVLRHKKPHVRAQHGLLCEGCIDRHRDWLKEIPDLYATLGEVVLAGSIMEEIAEHMHTKKAPASPSPLRLDAWAMLYGRLNQQIRIRTEDGSYEWIDSTLGSNLPDVPAVLAKWTQRAYEALCWTGAAPSTCSGAAALLSAQAEAVATLGNVTVYDAELRWVRRAVRSAHGLSDPKPLGTCMGDKHGGECVGNVMPDRYGGQPRCARCGRRYSDLDLVRLQITEEKTA